MCNINSLFVSLQHSHPLWKIISLPLVITALWNISPVFRPSPPADIPPCPSTCWGKRTLTGWMVFPSYGNSLPFYQTPLPTGRLCSPLPPCVPWKSKRQSSSVITPSDGIVLGFTVPSFTPSCPVSSILFLSSWISWIVCVCCECAEQHRLYLHFLRKCASIYNSLQFLIEWK